MGPDKPQKINNDGEEGALGGTMAEAPRTLIQQADGEPKNKVKGAYVREVRVVSSKSKHLIVPFLRDCTIRTTSTPTKPHPMAAEASDEDDEEAHASYHHAHHSGYGG